MYLYLWVRWLLWFWFEYIEVARFLLFVLIDIHKYNVSTYRSVYYITRKTPITLLQCYIICVTTLCVVLAHRVQMLFQLQIIDPSTINQQNNSAITKLLDDLLPHTAPTTIW